MIEAPHVSFVQLLWRAVALALVSVAGVLLGRRRDEMKLAKIRVESDPRDRAGR
jgi:hypothetical protein